MYGKSIDVKFVMTRVVCNNTLSMAHQLSEKNNGSSEKDMLIRVTHSNRTVMNMDKIKQIMDLENRNFYASLEMYRQLARKGIVQEDIVKFVKKPMN